MSDTVTRKFIVEVNASDDVPVGVLASMISRGIVLAERQTPWGVDVVGVKSLPKVISALQRSRRPMDVVRALLA